jgi:hypothetical protein
MLVKELVNILLEMPQDAVISVNHTNDIYSVIETKNYSTGRVEIVVEQDSQFDKYIRKFGSF